MAISLRIPGQSDSRRQELPIGVVPRVTWESRITGINQTCRSVLVHGTMQALLKAVVIEVVNEIVGLMLRCRRLPAQAVIQRQPWRCFPRILRVQAEVI